MLGRCDAPDKRDMVVMDTPTFGFYLWEHTIAKLSRDGTDYKEAYLLECVYIFR